MIQEVFNLQETASALVKMHDAAFPSGDEGYSGPIAGYFGGPDAYNVWPADTWQTTFRKNRKLPIWVGGFDGHAEGVSAVNALHSLQVPAGSYIANDVEERIDKTYLEHFGQVLNAAGYRVWVYGSASTVFGNPQLNGYWVADYAGIGPFMYVHDGVRATQYASGPNYDLSVIKPWTLAQMWQ